MKDADLENGVLKLVNTKGDKHRLVPMTEKMTNILTKYCLAMGLVGNGEAWLFPGNDRNDHISDHYPQLKPIKDLTFCCDEIWTFLDSHILGFYRHADEWEQQIFGSQ